MNAVYPAAVDAFLGGDIAVDANLIKAQLVEGYTYDSTHTTIADLSGTTLDSPVTLTGITIADGGVSCDPVTFTAVTDGHTVDGVVIYQDLDGPTSRLIAYIDRRADTVALAIDTNGGDITLTWTKLLKL